MPLARLVFALVLQLVLAGAGIAAPRPGPDVELGVDQLNQQAERIARSDPARAATVAQEAFLLARDQRYERGRIEALHNLGRIARLRGELSSASGYLMEALGAAEQIEEPRLIAKIANSLGVTLEMQGLGAEALAEHERVQELWRELNDSAGLVASSINIARVFQNRGALSDAERHYEAALEQSQVDPEAVPLQDRAAIHFGLGRIALRRGNLEQAETALQRALAMHLSASDRIGESATRALLAEVSLARGDEAAAHARYELALQLANESGARREIVEALGGLGALALHRAVAASDRVERRDHLTRALDFTRRALEQGHDDGARESLITLRERLAEIHEMQGDTRRALTELRTAQELRERARADEDRARYAMLANAANARERERELLALRAESEQQAELISQESQLKRMFAAAMFLLLGFLILLVIRFFEQGRIQRQRAEANTQLAQALQVAERARERAEEADRIKTEMLGIAAHDLRNPLSSIVGFADLIRAERDSLEVARRHAGIIVAAAERTLRLLSDLLDSAAIDTGKIKLHNQPIDLAALVGDCVGRARMRADSKSQQIDLRTTPGAFALADPARLEQVFDNLISNAIKFSPARSLIEVWTEITPEQVRITVKDYGPGLSADDRRLLFRRFQRLSARPTGGESSTGLGLAIVKELVELHGGQIRVESDGLGRGASFIVELPRLATPPLRLMQAANEPAERARVG